MNNLGKLFLSQGGGRCTHNEIKNYYYILLILTHINCLFLPTDSGEEPKLLTGTYRDGLHCSPLLAIFMAKTILNKNHSDNHFEIFKPERNLIQTMTQEESIEEALNHYMAGAYEHSMKLPRVGWDDMFKKLLLQKFHSLYDDLGINFGLPPDLLLMFDNNRKKHISYFKEIIRNNSINYA